MAVKPKLNVEDILKSEYEYIAHTAFQANEDRARVSSFYFVSVGSVVAAILSAQFAADSLKSVAIPFAFLFLVMTGLGGLTMAQLARLRAAWHESAQAMNQLKDFYLKHNPEIEPAFKWREVTLPPTDKPYSIANLIAVEVGLLSALTSATAVYFVLLAFGGMFWWSWGMVALAFLLGYVLLWRFYKFLLVDDR
ncbi:MAG TPA: hypothetical protein VIV15_04605 [Anaerolineales bacterium]